MNPIKAVCSHRHVPALLFLLLVLIDVSAPLLGLFLLVFALLLVFVFSLVLFASYGQVQGHRGRGAGCAWPFLLAVSTLG